VITTGTKAAFGRKKVFFIPGNHDRVIKKVVDQFVLVKEIGGGRSSSQRCFLLARPCQEIEVRGQSSGPSQPQSAGRVCPVAMNL
jgi:hypothetical protein